MNNSSSAWTSLHWRRHLEAFDSHDNPVAVSGPQGETDIICNLGELTDEGRRSSYALGTRLRNLYVDRLRFLPSIIIDPEIIYLRATRIPRAIESLQEAFWGMYPLPFRSESFPPPAIVLRAPPDETLTPNNGYCKRFSQLGKAFAQRSADRWNTSTDMDYLNSLIGKWMPESSKRVTMDSHPRLSGILDTINSTLAHGPETKLPEEFYDQKGMAVMDRLVIEEWFAGFNESQEYRALGIGSLMGDIVSRMVVSVEMNSKEGLDARESDENTSSTNCPKTAVKLGLSGCHDNTLGAILSSLGAFKMQSWPEYTSHIALELFRKADRPEGPASKTWRADKIASVATTNLSRQVRNEKRESPKSSAIARQKIDTLPFSERSKLDGFYVRIRYNDKPITVPGCKASGKHLESDETFCTLDAFKAIVDRFTPLHWKQDCWHNLEKPPFPAKPEPAGY